MLILVNVFLVLLSGCEQLNSCLDCLASEYSSVKFCRIDAVATGAAERFSSEVSKMFKNKILKVILIMHYNHNLFNQSSLCGHGSVVLVAFLVVIMEKLVVLVAVL